MKYIKLLIFFYLSFFIYEKTLADPHIITSLKDGGKLIFIRHALAPGNGDPDNFDLKNCNTQRNLNNIGINQSKNIGLFFKKINIPIDQILTSEWCRCKDTAKYAFNEFKTFSALNSFYQEKFFKNKKQQMIELGKFINNWKGDKNLILITHYVVIEELLNIHTDSGEIAITDKNLKLIARIETLQKDFYKEIN